ncbi:nucleotidyl transferase AbiEii/AbiGii toxin family protein [Clostridium sp. PL3]|uniref:Nucleotidyl transferase AbiEii/AbiGii toxin family protein n=1 Tax=Clostridium thailandense TaxID=2794346 RepID=A0A949TVD9_9CLOT|nr:nucleotidyl transferase AbiEii/AbiGii toxin family protein [Clostridium thailandense]MBV7274211.1 nucleotidyl transferase AbiEii/AbiGii toxin family protein [Clostridium thailandense]
MARNKKTILSHPSNNFTRGYIKSVSRNLGILNNYALEDHIWVYELHSQIQKRIKNRCILKGGASTQLHLPLEFQRLTADIDCATNLSRRELEKVMYSIKDDFNKVGIHCSYKEYIPKDVRLHGRTLPIMTFIFYMPFVFSSWKRKRYPGLKLDFLFLDIEKLHTTKLSKLETLGLELSYSPIVIDEYSTISDKFLTLSPNLSGLQREQLDKIYKNIYDLYCLINTYSDLKSFKIVSERFKESLDAEINMKNAKPIDIDTLLDDILRTTYDVATLSLMNNCSELPIQILRFQEVSMTKENRQLLNTDMWSIMALYIYIWVFSLKDYISKKNYSKLEGINVVISEFDYYKSLGKKERRSFKRSLKSRINSKAPFLNLEGTGHPLRLIYLDYILTNMKPF